MYRFASYTCSIAAVALAAPTFAGEEPRYEPAAEWVDAAKLDPADLPKGSPLLLMERQVRMEPGQVAVYYDVALAMESPEALTQMGTLTTQWMPDKGDIIVHRVEILRDGKIIDLLAQDARFEVLRREGMLERRMLNGMLTATMAVPGAQVGDVVRLAYTVTNSDQALGQEVEWADVLPAKPFPLKQGRIVLSWPKDLPINFGATRGAQLSQPETRGGYSFVGIDLPLDEADEIPFDAPGRYQMPALIQASSMDGWAGLSRVMAPHFSVEGTIAPGGDLAAEVARIEAAASGKKQRAALALQSVQDNISYLLNGMNGGNYLPQAPAETWQQRYGDCKAKSVLLLAMLREMGIESEAVLARSSFGDILPDMLPMAGAFDHVIVRAVIDGQDYWLDGTGSGTRLATMDEVPRFFHVLPLREEGSGLYELQERLQETPDRSVKIVLDQSAGIGVPALFDVNVTMSGAMGAPWRAVELNDDDDVRDQVVQGMIGSFLGQGQVVRHSITYDEASGIASISASGLLTSPWQRTRNRYELEPPAQSAAAITLSPDRARQAWRDIPVRVDGPFHFLSELEIILPDNADGFELRGEARIDQTTAGHLIDSTAALEGGRFSLQQRTQTITREIAADRVSEERRAATQLDRMLPKLRAPENTLQMWDYTGAKRSMLAAIEAVYARLIADADDDDATVYFNRAGFLTGIRDYAAAESDWTRAIEIEASVSLYRQRANARAESDNLEGALDDYAQAESLDPVGSTYYEQVTLLGLLGRNGDALALVDDFQHLAEEPREVSLLRAHALGFAGDAAEGLELIQDELAARPGDSALLNAACWHAGIWDMVDDEMLETCVEAVEKSDFSAAALDSRALVYYRLGQMDAAVKDLDAALLVAPGLAEPRFMRGIVKLAQGDKTGRADVDKALTMKPSIERTYRAYGIQAP